MRKPRDQSSFREYSYVRECRSSERIIYEHFGNLPRVALIFPNSYKVASSSLAWSWIQQLLWRHGVGVERFFHETWFERFYSVETQRPLDEFPIWLFTFQFENDMLNILDVLEKKGVPVLNSDRDEYHPVIVVGGPVTSFNHRILEYVADVTFIGDLEPSAEEFAESLMAGGKTEVLEKLAELDQTYSPLLGKVSFRRPNFRLDEVPVSHFSSSNSAFKDKILVEVGRGCKWRCAFCVTGHVKKPVNFAPLERVLSTLESMPNSEFGFVSATITDYPHLDGLLSFLESCNIRFSVSSLRIDNVSERLLTLLRRSEKNSITIAPEGVSQKIRDVMLKDMRTEGIIRGLQLARAANFTQVKMYFIVGLEEETEEDYRELAELISETLRIGFQRVTLSVNPLVPKPKTPFETRPFLKKRDYEDRLRLLKKSAPKDIAVEAESYRSAELQFTISHLVGRETIEFAENLGKHVLRR